MNVLATEGSCNKSKDFPSQKLEMAELEKSVPTTTALSLAKLAQLTQKAAASTPESKISELSNVSCLSSVVKSLGSHSAEVESQETPSSAASAIKALSALSGKQAAAGATVSAPCTKAERRVQVMEAMGEEDVHLLFAATRTSDGSTKGLSTRTGNGSVNGVTFDESQEMTWNRSKSCRGLGLEESLESENKRLMKKINSVRNILPKEDSTTSSGLIKQSLEADNEKLLKKINGVRSILPKEDKKESSSKQLKRRSSQKRLTPKDGESSKPLGRSNSRTGLGEEGEKKPLRRSSSRSGLGEEGEKKPLRRSNSRSGLGEDFKRKTPKRSSTFEDKSKPKSLGRGSSRRQLGASEHKTMRRCKTMDEGEARKQKTEEGEDKRSTRRRRPRRVQSQPEGALVGPAAAVAKQQEGAEVAPAQRRRSSRVHPARDVRTSQIQQVLKLEETLPEEPEEEEVEVQKPVIKEDETKELTEDSSNQKNSLGLPSIEMALPSIDMSKFVPKFSMGWKRSSGDKYGQMDSSCANHIDKEDSTTATSSATFSECSDDGSNNDSHSSSIADDSEALRAEEDKLGNTESPTRKIRQRQRRAVSRKSVTTRGTTANRRQGSKRRLSSEGSLPELVH